MKEKKQNNDNEDTKQFHTHKHTHKKNDTLKYTRIHIQQRHMNNSNKKNQGRKKETPKAIPNIHTELLFKYN